MRPVDDMHALETHEPARSRPAPALRVHAIRTGRLVGNRTFLRGEGWASLLRARVDVEFPAFCFLVEHPEGLIAIDAGMAAGVRVGRPQWRVVPRPGIAAHEEVGPQLRARGIDPAAVRRVVLTHLDWDHVGGIGHYDRAEVLVHRPEHAFSRTLAGRIRYRPQDWPGSFAPTLYDLDEEPLGPFPRSRRITEDGAVRVVPLPGHTPGQVGVVVRTGEVHLLFAGDHALRQDWFLADFAEGRLVQLGVWSRRHAEETSRRIHEFARELPTVLLPSHDDAIPARLATREPLVVPGRRADAPGARSGDRKFAGSRESAGAPHPLHG